MQMSNITSPSDRLEDLVADFSFLDNWEDRFRHIIDLGRELEDLSSDEKVAQNKVQGCTSQVWLISHFNKPDNLIIFKGNSDSTLVQGLLAILLKVYSNANPNAILELDPMEIFKSLELMESLTPNRSNGLVAMVNKIREFATECL